MPTKKCVYVTSVFFDKTNLLFSYDACLHIFLSSLPCHKFTVTEVMHMYNVHDNLCYLVNAVKFE